MCSLTTESVLSLQNAFSHYRMRSLTTECVLSLQKVFSHYRKCSLTTECVLSLQNVLSYSPFLRLLGPLMRLLLTLTSHRPSNVTMSYDTERARPKNRKCSLTTECVLLLTLPTRRVARPKTCDDCFFLFFFHAGVPSARHCRQLSTASAPRWARMVCAASSSC